MKRAVTLCIVVFCTTMTIVQTGAQPTQSGAEVAAIRQIADNYVKAVLAGDAKAVAVLYTDDAVEMPPNQPIIKGREAIEQAYQKDFTSGHGKPTSFTLDHMDTNASGDTAYDVATYRQSITPTGGQAINDTGKAIVILKRTADAWKVAYAIYNSDLPARPPAPTQPQK